jgi:hypothetical protein
MTDNTMQAHVEELSAEEEAALFGGAAVTASSASPAIGDMIP